MTRLDLPYLARLARLNLTPRQKKIFARQLDQVLTFARKLEKLDLKKVPPTFQTTGARDRVREDRLEPERTLPQEEALSGSQEKERGFFRVPKVLP